MAHWKPAKVQHERALDRQRKKSLYDLRRSSGVCIYCGKEETNGKAACSGCKSKRQGVNPRRKSRYRASAKLGICVSCNSAEAAPGRRRCGYCLEYHQEATERFRERARSKGMCSGCLTRIPESGKTCSVCRERGRIIKARNRAKRRADARR